MLRKFKSDGIVHIVMLVIIVIMCCVGFGGITISLTALLMIWSLDNKPTPPTIYEPKDKAAEDDENAELCDTKKYSIRTGPTFLYEWDEKTSMYVEVDEIFK